MAGDTATAPSPGLSLPHETFAKVAPGPFLLNHLKQENPKRANGRRLDEYRQPDINTGSLTHSNGSAVVRCGNTAVVCGVRAEILHAADIPFPPSDDVVDSSQRLEELGLLVPNVELSTGCSQNHLPGNPPGTQAQSLSYRIRSLLHASNLINADDLRIRYVEPVTDDDAMVDGDEDAKPVTKAYWTLYIDVLVIALDGNAFDTVWMAAIAALRNTVLPRAQWDADRNEVICSPEAAEAVPLKLAHHIMPTTFVVFSTASPLKHRADAESWVLVDPDGFEEDVCTETLTLAVLQDEAGQVRLLKIEKSGGAELDLKRHASCFEMAKRRLQTFADAVAGL